jgi:hypothetical protein
MAQGSEPGPGTIARGRQRWLRLDDQAITVRNYYRTHRIGWNEVHWFRDGLGIRDFDHRGPVWALEIVLHDGRKITAEGTSGQQTARPETLAAIRQAAERHAVPAVLTGTTDAVHRGEPDAAGLYPDPGGKPALRQWTGTGWAPFLRVDPASSGPEGEPGPATVWSPLPEAEQRRQWDAAASRARDTRFGLSISLVFAAGVVAAIVAAVVYELGKPKADFGLVWVLALGCLPLCAAGIWGGWTELKVRRKVDQAGKAAAVLAGATDSAASPLDDRGEDPLAG